MWRDKVDLIIFLITLVMVIVWMATGQETNFTGFMGILAGYIFYAMYRMGTYTDQRDEAIASRDNCYDRIDRYDVLFIEELQKKEEFRENFNNLKDMIEENHPDVYKQFMDKMGK